MNSVETLIWSAHAGGFAMLILISMAVASIHRTMASAVLVVWLAACSLMIMALNGLLPLLAPGMSAADFQAVRVVLGPLCIALSGLGLRVWLGISLRNRIIDFALIANASACALLGMACLLLPEEKQFSMSAVVTLGGVLLISLLCWWAALLGDRFAWMMATVGFGQLLTLAAGYALTLDYVRSQELHAATAAGNLCCMLFISALIWLRSHSEYLTSQGQSTSSTHDPSTGLYNGKTIIKKILSAQGRLKFRQSEGAILAILVLNLEPLESQIGLSGIQELLIRSGARVQREVGLINPVGRYFDRCFVVLLETARSTDDVQKMTAALSRALTQPLGVKGLHGEMQSIALHVGVGAARLTYQSDVAAVLHRAEASARGTEVLRTVWDAPV